MGKPEETESSKEQGRDKRISELETNILEQADLLEQKAKLLQTQNERIEKLEAVTIEGHVPAGSVEITDNKGAVLSIIEDVSASTMQLLSKAREIEVDNNLYKVLTTRIAVNTQGAECCLVIGTSHHSSIKAVRHPVTRKWVSPDIAKKAQDELDKEKQKKKPAKQD